MSIPPLVTTPNIEEPIVLATPFSYKIKSSGLLPGHLYEYEPTYTSYTFPTPVLTISDNTSVETNQWSTNFRIDTNESQYEDGSVNINFNGNTYSITNLVEPYYFDIQIPWMPNPVTEPLDIELGRIRFGPFSFQLQSAAYNDIYRNFKMYINNVYNDTYSYTETDRQLYFSVGIEHPGQGMWYNFPGGFDGFYPIQSSYSISFDNMIFYKQNYTDYTQVDPNDQTINGFIVNDVIAVSHTDTYTNITSNTTHACIQNIPEDVYEPRLSTYGPYGGFNYEYWWPVPLDQLYTELWVSTIWYIPYQIIRVRVGNVDRYYKLISNQYPNRDAYPPDNLDIWTLVGSIPVTNWNSSTQYIPGNYVQIVGQGDPPNGSWPFYLCRQTNTNFNPTSPNYVYWYPISINNNIIDFTIEAPTTFQGYLDYYPNLTVYTEGMESLPFITGDGTSSELLQFITGNGTNELTVSSPFGLQSITNQPLKLVIYESPFFYKEYITDLTGTDPYIQNVNSFVPGQIINIDTGSYICIDYLPPTRTTLRTYGPSGPYNYSKYWPTDINAGAPWDPLIPYVTDELVTADDGFSYRAVRDSKGVDPINNPSYWTQLTTEQTNQSFAVWDSSSSYAKGIYVFDNGIYYLTRSAITPNIVPTDRNYVYWVSDDPIDLTGSDPYIQNLNGFVANQKIIIETGTYQCIKNLPLTGNTFRTYGPDGAYNDSKYWLTDQIPGNYWDPLIPYVTDELVSAGDEFYYRAVQNSKNQNPINNSSYWTQFTSEQTYQFFATWDSSSSYAKGVYVNYNNNYYLTRSAVPANTLPTDRNYVYWIPNTDSLINYTTTYQITCIPFSITTTPTLTSPLSLVTYEPFDYTFSVPNSVVNVTLRYNPSTTSTSLVPYITNGGTPYEIDFRSTTGLTATGSAQFVIEAILNSITVDSSNISVVSTATLITITPSIPSGTLSFYKYEPFSYTFTTNSYARNLSFQVSRSSSELQTFLTVSEDLQSVTFSGTFAIGYTNTLSLIVDLMFGTTIIDTKITSITVGQGRFFPPAPNQNFQLYQYENVSNTFGSNIMISTIAPMTTIVSSPSLPSGLTFGGSCNSFYIQGKPLLQVNQGNYQIIGTNSSNGRLITTTISLRVNPTQVLLTPSASSLTGLNIDTAIEPITTTALQPETIYSKIFTYTWTSLPDGLNFQDIDGNNVYQPFTPQDPASTIILTGSPTTTFAQLMTTLDENLYQTRLTGTQTDEFLTRTVGTSLFNFSLGETVLVTATNSVPLFINKPLGTTDVLITAGSFFSGGSTIESLTANSLPPGLSLVEYISPTVYRLTGTPTVVNLYGSYTFTATNTNEISESVTITIPVNSDVVTFGGSTPPNGTVVSYVISKTITPIVFSATSTSTVLSVTYSASIPFANYGLTFNSTTGTLTGTPTASLSSTTVTITATNIFGTTGTTTIQLTILPDSFTWPTYAPTYFQNKPITPFKFVISSTLSGRSILSFSSGNLPLGMFINQDGLLSGTPSAGSSGSFRIEATTGYTTLSQVYNYTIIADQLIIVQTNRTDTVSKVFSGVEYRTIQYSTDTSVNATFTIGALSPSTSATIAVTSGGLLSGNFTSGTLNQTYSATLTAVYQGVTSTLPIYITVGSTNLIITAVINGITVTAASVSIVTGASAFYDGNNFINTYTTSIEHGLQVNDFIQISGFGGLQSWANTLMYTNVIQVINSFQFRVNTINYDGDQSFSNTTTPGYINNGDAYYTTATPHGLTPGSKTGSISGLTNSFYNQTFNFNVERVPSPTTFVLSLLDNTLPSITQQNGLLTYIGQPTTSLTFTQPKQTAFTFFEYVPYTIPIQATGSASFIYYFSSGVPNGFQLIKDITGVTAILSGISPTIANQGIIIYAKTAIGYAVSISLSLRTITPFFINPQVGAGAYTALLRNDVEGNAAQNARDNRTFPEVNPLAGPLMAPRAPDVTTPSDCILKLCKKPCPTCHTMM